MSRYFRVVIVATIIYITGMAVFWYYMGGGLYTADPDGSDMRLKLTVGMAIAGVIFLFAALLYGAYLARHIVGPLKDMKKYAEKIKEGDFDTPPAADGGKILDPINESFDIVCTELTKSRDREIALKNRETELIVSLSRDLKEPALGIRRTADLLRTKLRMDGDCKSDTTLLENLDIIYDKSDQMETLVTSVLSSALEDLGEFKVSCADTESTIITDILKKHDDRGLVESGPIPGVLIHIDARRLSQVIGNIIINSYQYANTRIDVGYLLTDEYLQMKISDHGPGVSPDEIGRITDRFYRTRLGADRSEEGSGLGLYIARTLMEKMEGKLLVDGSGEGLCVTLLIKLS